MIINIAFYISRSVFLMLYLFLAICCSSLISIMMRSGENRIRNNISTLAINYVICTALSLFYAMYDGTGSAAAGIITRGEGVPTAVALGLINGFFYVGSFILLQYNIRKNGVVLPSTFMKLGVLVPTMIAIIAFGERPGALQVTGIIMAVTAILLMNAGGGRTDIVTAPKALILLLIVGGSGDAMSKVFEELGDSSLNSQFLLYTFAMALLLCTLTAIIKKQKLTGTDLLYGCLIGIPNYYSARFLLMSLSYVPAVIAYPTYSTCTIIFVGAAGVLFFREKMSARQWITVCLIIAALVLLNIA